MSNLPELQQRLADLEFSKKCLESARRHLLPERRRFRQYQIQERELQRDISYIKSCIKRQVLADIQTKISRAIGLTQSE